MGDPVKGPAFAIDRSKDRPFSPPRQVHFSLDAGVSARKPDVAGRFTHDLLLNSPSRKSVVTVEPRSLGGHTTTGCETVLLRKKRIRGQGADQQSEGGSSATAVHFAPGACLKPSAFRHGCRRQYALICALINKSYANTHFHHVPANVPPARPSFAEGLLVRAPPCTPRLSNLDTLVRLCLTCILIYCGYRTVGNHVSHYKINILHLVGNHFTIHYQTSPTWWV